MTTGLDRLASIFGWRACLSAVLLVLVATAAMAIEVPRRITNMVFDPIGTFGAYGRYDPAALVNPLVDGVDILMDWADVEVSQGHFDFAPADAVAEAWSKAGKKFAVVIRYTNESPHGCDKQQHIPKWEMRRIPYFCDSVYGNIIPNYFDATFKQDLKTYVKTVADHFANSPFRGSLLYVRIGIGLGSESVYLTPCRRSQPCDYETGLARLRAWGLTPEAWERWQQEMLTSYQQAFSYSRVIYALNRLEINPTTGALIQSDVAFWAAARGMGLGALGLSPRFADGPAQIRTIMRSVRERYPATYIQLQTVRPVRDTEELRLDLELARQLGANAIEWYAADVNRPEYQELLMRGTRDE